MQANVPESKPNPHPDLAKKLSAGGPNVAFLPDADEIEQRPLPAFARITLPVMLLALISAIVWAIFSDMDQIVIARGRLINPMPNIVVQPLETSIVQKIHVRVGQVVKKGELLATLDPTFIQSDEAQLRTKLRSLNTQSQALTVELAGGAVEKGGDADSLLQSKLAYERKGNLQAQQIKIEENIARLRASLATNQKDQQVLAARLKSLLEIESMQEKLVAQQYGARMHLLEARDKRLEVERDQLMTGNREQEIKRELGALEADKVAFNKGCARKQ